MQKLRCIRDRRDCRGSVRIDLKSNENYDKIKAADNKGTVVRKLLKLEKIQGAEYSESAMESFKKDIVGESAKQAKEDMEDEDDAAEKERESC